MKRPLTAVLLTLAACLLLVAGGSYLLRERHLRQQRHAELRREEAADLVVSALEKALTRTEAALRDRDAVRAAAATPDSISLIFEGERVEALPYGRLLYQPVAASGFPSPEAEALIRAARDLRARGEHDAALAAYAKATRMSWTAIGDVPTELFARSASCDLLAALGRTRQLRIDALELRDLLLEGRWRITRPVFESHLAAATAWSRAGEPPAVERLALSAAVDRLWNASEGTPPARSRLNVERVHFTVLQQWADGRRTALVAGPMYVEGVWKAQIRPLEEKLAVRLELMDPAAEQQMVESTRRAADVTGLPWTIVLRPAVRARSGVGD